MPCDEGRTLLDGIWLGAGFSAEILPGPIVVKPAPKTELILWSAAPSDLFAASAFCPHRGALLGATPCDPGSPQPGAYCQFHGARFLSDGSFDPGSTGLTISSLAPIRAVDVGGQVLATRSSASLAPIHELFDDTRMIASYELRFPMVIADLLTRILLIADNLFDPHHVKPIHDFDPGLHANNLRLCDGSLKVDVGHMVRGKRLVGHRATMVPGVLALDTPVWGGASFKILETIAFDGSDTVIRATFSVPTGCEDGDRLSTYVTKFAAHHKILMSQDIPVWTRIRPELGESDFAFRSYPEANAYFDPIIEAIGFGTALTEFDVRR